MKDFFIESPPADSDSSFGDLGKERVYKANSDLHDEKRKKNWILEFIDKKDLFKLR